MTINCPKCGHEYNPQERSRNRFGVEDRAFPSNLYDLKIFGEIGLGLTAGAIFFDAVLYLLTR